MFVAISKFEVRTSEMALAVKQAFADRPHLVDDADGFVRLDVVSPVENPNEIWLMTYGRNRSSYESWHKSHATATRTPGYPPV